MHVEIRPGSGATEQSGKTKDGKAYSLRVQQGWLITSDGEVRKLKLTLNREQAAYEPGVYDLDDSCFTVNNFGELGIDRYRISLKARPAVKPATIAGRQAG